MIKILLQFSLNFTYLVRNICHNSELNGLTVKKYIYQSNDYLFFSDEHRYFQCFIQKR